MEEKKRREFEKAVEDDKEFVKYVEGWLGDKKKKPFIGFIDLYTRALIKAVKTILLILFVLIPVIPGGLFFLVAHVGPGEGTGPMLFWPAFGIAAFVTFSLYMFLLSTPPPKIVVKEKCEYSHIHGFDGPMPSICPARCCSRGTCTPIGVTTSFRGQAQDLLKAVMEWVKGGSDVY